VVLSLLYRLVRCLFGLLAVLVRSDLSKDVEWTRAGSWNSFSLPLPG
jgi:hypothetical protein